MKIVKIVGIILVSIVALVLIIALFLPSKAHIERSVEINKPVNEVYAEVIDFNNWPKWDPWLAQDSTAKHSATGTPGEPGASRVWEGEKVGKGSMVLEVAKPNELIKSKLVFQAPNEGEAKTEMRFQSIEGKTKVTQTFDSDAGYPLGRIMCALFLDKILGEQFDKGLTGLKKVCEAK